MSGLHTYYFEFLSDRLKIEFIKNIPTDLADGIFTLIALLKKDLNSKTINSSAYKLNHSAVNLPITVSPDFFEFFETSIKYFVSTSSNFSPFKEELDKYSLQKYFSLNKEKNIIVKLKDFIFESSLLKPYILTKITELIKRNKFEDYYFQYLDIVATFGKATWKAKFELEDLADEIKFDLRDRFALLYSPNHDVERVKYQKFANLDKEINPLYIVLTGKNILDLKILSLELANFQWLHQFKTYKQENNIEIIIYDEKRETIVV